MLKLSHQDWGALELGHKDCGTLKLGHQDWGALELGHQDWGTLELGHQDWGALDITKSHLLKLSHQIVMIYQLINMGEDDLENDYIVTNWVNKIVTKSNQHMCVSNLIGYYIRSSGMCASCLCNIDC